MKSQQSQPLSHASLARRVAVAGSLGVAVLIGLSCLALSLRSAGHEREVAAALARSEAGAIARMADAFDAQARLMAERFYNTFATEFSGRFSQNTEGELVYDGRKLAGNFEAVDRFSQNTGGAATIFVREGNDFRRIATSLKKENGERAIGTLLGTTHPAHDKLIDGQAYVGRAQLFGKPFMNRYEPIRDAKGGVIGILFVGFDTSGFQQSLEQLAGGVKLFEHGGVFLLDPKGASGKPLLRGLPGQTAQPLAERVSETEAFMAQLEDGALIQKAPALLNRKAEDSWLVARQSKDSGLWVLAEVLDHEALGQYWINQRALWLTLGGASLALAIGLSLLLRHWLGGPLRSLNRAVARVADGDLSTTVTVRRNDDLGALAHSVEAMRQRLAQTLGSVREATDSISTASAQVAAGSQDLSGRTEQGAGSLQQIASSVEQLAAAVTQTAEAAQSANSLAGNARDVASQGGALMGRVVTTMDEINGASRKISDIIGTIDNLAFQTNILALNAAVEAARAGDQGRGFAVVASEVRSLAQRSAEAAKEIKRLIVSSVEQIEVGTELVHQAGDSMGEIVASVERVSAVVAEISTATQEQRAGIGEVNGAITQLDGSTQQNAALVEQSTAAAESLREQARNLAEVVGGFRLQPV